MSGKGSNVLPLWGNEKTMNLNNMILTNIQSSPYFKVQLFDLKTYHEVIDEIFYKVTHLEPWEKGSRKLSGQTGMCGGVRGVGAGGIVSSAFCLLYKLYTLKLTRKQLTGLLNHGDSPYIRGLGFMYVRYTQPPQDLWDWMEPYMDDDEEIDVKAGGGCVMTIGEMCREFLVKLDWYSALFPRIPVPIQKDLDVKLRSLPPPPRAAGAASGVTGGDDEEEHAQNGGNGAWANRERAEGVDRSATDDDGSRDNGHRRPIPTVRSPPRRDRKEKSPDGHKHHGRRPDVPSSRGDDDDYRRALEREKERQRKSHHSSPSSGTSPRRSAESRDRRNRSRSHDRKHRHRSGSNDRHRDKTPSRDKSGRKDRPRSRDRSPQAKHRSKRSRSRDRSPQAKDRSKRSRSRDRAKRRRSSSTERHIKKASSRDRHGDSCGTASGSSKSRRSPAKGDDRSPVRDREGRSRYEQHSPSVKSRQDRDRSRSADARKKRKVSRSHSRERDHHASRARNSDSPHAKD